MPTFEKGEEKCNLPTQTMSRNWRRWSCFSCNNSNYHQLKPAFKGWPTNCWVFLFATDYSWGPISCCKVPVQVRKAVLKPKENKSTEEGPTKYNKKGEERLERTKQTGVQSQDFFKLQGISDEGMSYVAEFVVPESIDSSIWNWCLDGPQCWTVQLPCFLKLMLGWITMLNTRTWTYQL